MACFLKKVSNQNSLFEIGVFSFHWQGIFPDMLYFHSMHEEGPKIDLTGMRERAGISRRELARQLNTSHTNVNSWEKAGWIAKAEFIVPAAAVLGVTVDDLLGVPKSRSNPIPGGKLGQAFEATAKLPRSKQDKVIALLDAFIAQHSLSA